MSIGRAIGRAIPMAFALVLAFAPVAGAQNPFSIDGVITDADNSGVPGALKTLDPNGNTGELGPINGSPTKIGVIHFASLPMLGFTSQPDKVDLNAVWTQVATSADAHQWFYFAWARDSRVGSGFIAIEIQQAALPAACTYEGLDMTSPASTGEQALIDACNPWKNRQAGDFLILWDQQGGSTDIYKRVFSGTAPNLVLGPLQAMGTAVAVYSSDNFRGELAIDLTVDVFGGVQECTSFANMIPSTVTGNSDTADYKDTVLGHFPPISNCGIVDVVKYAYYPDGTTRYTGATGTFNYTLSRSSGDLRYVADFPPPASLTEVTGTLSGDGDKDTHELLIAGTNYTLVEDTSNLAAQHWQWMSTKCTVGDGTTEYETGAIPVVIGEVTHCIIRNKFVRASPSGVTVQKVTLFDHVTISGMIPTSSRVSTVTFRLFSDAACTVQVGTDIVASLFYNDTYTSATADTYATTNRSASSNGKFYWRVIYAGDLLNNGFTTGCGDESTEVIFIQ